ncbi:MAG: 4-demethylwyosine synthase TYW1 [Euryarchaeota archaeon]|nr:4-demethylwyosine synthase TYW1 [Euryarchaeota archaeon]
MKQDLKELLYRQGYRVVGNHSAVKTCHWTRESLLKGRTCYKERFYGIESHRCLQMSPAVAWCQHSCVFCWRPVEHSLGVALDCTPDEPADIVEGAVRQQRELLSGYWGEQRADRKKVEEAMDPNQVAISLAGEPTTYPRLPEQFHSRGFTTFLVTNGQNPGMLEELEPTQLYLSLIAPTRDIYRRTNRPLLKNGWERLMESVDIMGEKNGRTVLRLTLVRGYNLEVPRGFAPLVERARPDFIEPKGYVHVGYSRRRLQRDDMPTFREVMEFSEILAGEVNYKVKDFSRDSKVVLLAR